MKASFIALTLAAAALAACTTKETKVVATPAPAPAPTVVVAPPAVVPAPTQGQVMVTYTAQSYDLAQRTAASYCSQHYGSNGAELVSDDRVGHATYACVM